MRRREWFYGRAARSRARPRSRARRRQRRTWPDRSATARRDGSRSGGRPPADSAPPTTNPTSSKPAGLAQDHRNQRAVPCAERLADRRSRWSAARRRTRARRRGRSPRAARRRRRRQSRAAPACGPARCRRSTASSSAPRVEIGMFGSASLDRLAARRRSTRAPSPLGRMMKVTALMLAAGCVAGV